MKKRDVEVLFCFEPYDELVLLQLREFDRKQLTSVEKDMRQDSNPEKTTDEKTGKIDTLKHKKLKSYFLTIFFP